MNKEEPNTFLKRAFLLALDSINNQNGGPFGAVIVKDGIVIGEGFNSVTSTNDPTAHAEINAIRNACEKTDSFQLSGCDIYCTSEPCPMCLGALYWARIDRIFYSTNRLEAAQAGFDDGFIYDEIKLTPDNRSIKMYQLSNIEGKKIFKNWAGKKNKISY